MKLNERINQWKKELRRFRHLEDGVIAELEDHLLEEIKNLIERGYSEEEAFERAKDQIGDIVEVDRDEHRVLTGPDGLFIIGLLKSFVKVGSRHFRRSKLISAINMIGLTTAFTAVLFIGIFIHDELNYERHHSDWDKIYRLSYSFQEENGEVEDRAFSSGMWAEILADRSPAVSDYFRFLNISYGYIHNALTDETFYEEEIYWSDPNFFEFLNFRLKYGEPQSQLKNLNSLILTETRAEKIFGNENPLGKRLKYVRRNNEVDLVVTGVIYDPPSNSQFQPDYIAHIHAIQNIYGEEHRGWVDKNPAPGYIRSYLKISDPKAVQTVSAELTSFWKEMIPERSESIKPLLTPLGSIHFNPPIKWEMDTPINMSYLYGLIVIGVFILTVAVTNFINLTTAQGTKRSKEIGLRKTLGSTKNQLRVQFFIETALVVSVSLILALLLTYLALPKFNGIVDKNVNFWSTFWSTSFLYGFLSMALSIFMVSGVLPALYFTRKIGKSLGMNQVLQKEKFNSLGRNILVVVQFTVAITLIIGTIIIFNQLQLINSGHLAVNREAVIGIRTSRMGDSIQAQRYKQKILSIPGVLSNTLGVHLPRQTDFGRINTKYYAREISDEPFYWNKFDADGGFLKTYDLKLLNGKDFRRNIEPNGVIVNEALVRQLGIKPEEAVGLYLQEDSINYVYWSSHGKIIGVVKDFVYKSIKEPVEPLVICANNYVGGALSVKLDGAAKQATISLLEDAWKEVYPGRPFEYWFLDQEFERMYNQERRLGKLIPVFSALAVVIALLGLFALTVFVAELRRKEIGIRKVLGCSTSNILKLLGWQFLRNLIPAILIGIPLSYFGLSYWLNNFTYRVEVSISVILLSVTAIVVFALLTVSFKSLAAATGNPVDSLKYE